MKNGHCIFVHVALRSWKKIKFILKIAVGLIVIDYYNVNKSSVCSLQLY